MLAVDDRGFDPTDRSIAGHWEGDLIVGPHNRSAIGTLVERQTRFVKLLHLPAHNSTELLHALVRTLNELPSPLRRTVTWDQGTEMAPAPRDHPGDRNENLLLRLGKPVAARVEREREWAPSPVRPEVDGPLRSQRPRPRPGRERTQQPASDHPRRSSPSRSLRDAASLRESPLVAMTAGNKPRPTHAPL